MGPPGLCDPAAASALFAASSRNDTRTPISGRMRGSFRSIAIRTFTVALLRSAVGMMAITCAGIVQSGYASRTASRRLFGPDAVDVGLVDINFDFQRVHVDDRAHTGARKSTTRGDRRDDLARLRRLRGHDTGKWRSHSGVVELHLGAALRGHRQLDLSDLGGNERFLVSEPAYLRSPAPAGRRDAGR